jgi:micrococcal nuclease
MTGLSLAPSNAAPAETPASIGPPPPSPSAAAAFAPTGSTEPARVVRVVDGDTIVVDRGRGQEKLRYIGVDTPETVKPGSPVERMGPQASAANHALVEGREVILERDVSEYDRYGRLLRYVWLNDSGTWTLVNLALVAAGYAQVVTYPPDVKYVERYLAAQAEARDAGRGLWGESPTTERPSAPAGSSAHPGQGACDPAYPRVCIPPPPPDLDCRDVPYRRFEVLAPDPHRFDGDLDGVGCES